MNAMKGVMGITIIESVLGMSLAFWVAIITHSRVIWFPWGSSVFMLALYFVNVHFLVSRGTGVEFEKKFNTFSVAKRTVLICAAVAILLTTGGIAYISGAAYRHAFNISDPPSRVNWPSEK